jgi:Mannosyltransferase (PIG-V)
MSATTFRVRGPAVPAAVTSGGPSRARVVVAGLIGSRLIVLAAGLVGALATSRRAGWQTFDQAGLSSHLGHLGDTMAAAALRWDSVHYLTIAHHGYRTAADAVFYPLYPLLLRVLGGPVASEALAGVVISVASLAAALVLLHRLTELELGRTAADATALLLCFAPLSFFFSAVYTESLFLALSVGAIYAARVDRFGLACMLAALASVTRVQGVLLVVPLALVWGRENGFRVNRRLAWMLLPPAALGAFSAYLELQGLGWTASVSGQSSASYQRHLTGPVTATIDAVRAAASGLGGIFRGIEPVYVGNLGGPFSRGAESVVLLLVLIAAVWAVVAVWRRLSMPYAAYATFALAISISSPVPLQPLVSFDRYALTIFPVWMVAGEYIARRRVTTPVVCVSGALLLFYSYQFATWAFVA